MKSLLLGMGGGCADLLRAGFEARLVYFIAQAL